MLRHVDYFRHSKHAKNRYGADILLPEEVDALTSLYPIYSSGEQIAAVLASPRPDVLGMAALYAAVVPKEFRPDPNSGDLTVHLCEVLRSRISDDPERKAKLQAAAKDAGLSIDDYAMLQSTGLYPEITKWADEVLRFFMNYGFETPGNIVCFTHGVLLEGIVMAAEYLRLGGQLERFYATRASYDNSPLLKGTPIENCAGVRVTFDGNRVVGVELLARPVLSAPAEV